jgi:hypothetical protein
VRQVVQECQQTTQRHRLPLEGPAMLQASVDAGRLQRVVGNPVGNAIVPPTAARSTSSSRRTTPT